MSEVNFIDHIKIHCRSGNGGAGSLHFRREKFVPKGGPDGGDGGKGGSIIFKGNRNLWTLLHLRYTRHITAENGKPGSKSRSSGASGKNVIIDVPLGTTVKHEDGSFAFEVLEHDEEKVLFEGGRGGLGNWHFKTSTKQTPRYAQGGEEGKEGSVVLELKVLADVGLVGFPNAGKSTLLSVVTSAKPEIADYPFTTIKPNLGIVKYRDYFSFVIADIPGLIEGASEGKGLGHRFLKHIERNAALLFLIPADSEEPLKDFKVLENELASFNEEILHKKIVIGISKIDLVDEQRLSEIKKEFAEAMPNLKVTAFSSVTQKGLTELKDLLWETINKID